MALAPTDWLPTSDASCPRCEHLACIPGPLAGGVTHVLPRAGLCLIHSSEGYRYNSLNQILVTRICPYFHGTSALAASTPKASAAIASLEATLSLAKARVEKLRLHIAGANIELSVHILFCVWEGF